jgi:hypothetical protein
MLDVSYKHFSVSLAVTVTQYKNRLLKYEILNKSLSVCRIPTPHPKTRIKLTSLVIEIPLKRNKLLGHKNMSETYKRGAG